MHIDTLDKVHKWLCMWIFSETVQKLKRFGWIFVLEMVYTIPIFSTTQPTPTQPINPTQPKTIFVFRAGCNQGAKGTKMVLQLREKLEDFDLEGCRVASTPGCWYQEVLLCKPSYCMRCASSSKNKFTKVALIRDLHSSSTKIDVFPPCFILLLRNSLWRDAFSRGDASTRSRHSNKKAVKRSETYLDIYYSYISIYCWAYIYIYICITTVYVSGWSRKIHQPRFS